MRHLWWWGAAAAACDDHIVAPDFSSFEPGFCGVEQVFAASCQNAGCHGGGSASGGLDLETDPYAALIDVTSPTFGLPHVVPGDSAASFLYQKVAGTQGANGARMPVGAVLSDAAIAHVAEWIDDGAAPCGEER